MAQKGVEGRWSQEENNLSTASYYGGRYTQSNRIVKAGVMMQYYLWNYLVFYKSFHKTGKRAATRPWLVISIVVIFAAVLSGGVFMRTFQTDPDVLNLSETSPATQYRHLFEEAFEEKTASLIFSPRGGALSTFSKDQLLEIMGIYEGVLGIKVEREGVSFDYPSMCFRAREACATYGILGYWGFDRSRLEAQEEQGIGEVVAAPASYSFGPPIELDEIAGGVTFEDGVVTSIVATKMVFHLAHFASDDRAEIQREWQSRFLAYASEIEASFEVSYIASASRDVEGEEELGSDWVLIVLAWVALAVFGGLALFRKNLIDSHTMLILAALVHSLMAYAVSTGLSGYMGTKDVPANRFCILVTFIFSLHHVYVLVRNYKRTDPNEPVEERIAIAEQHTGMQLFLITLNVFVSYMAGSLFPLEGLHSFCLRLGLCILMEQQFLLTWFCAWLGIDARRSAAGRLDCLPCVTSVNFPPERISRADVFNSDTPLSRLYTHFVSRFKYLILVATFTMFGVGIYGMVSSNPAESMTLAKAYPNGMAGQGYVSMEEQWLSHAPPPAYIVLNQVDFRHPATADHMEQLILNVTENEYVLEGSLVAWYPAYLEFQTDKSDFYANLADFLASEEGRRFSPDLVLDGEGRIALSRFSVRLDPAMAGSRFSDFPGQLAAKDSLVGMALNHNITEPAWDVFAYSPDWPLVTSYPKVQETLYELFIVSVLALTGMEAIFIPPSLVVSIMATSFMSGTCMMGLLHLFGIGITPATAYWVLFSWGFSAEYSIHFLYDFMSIPGPDKSWRAERALTLGSSSILTAGIVSALSVVPLLFGTSELAYTFPLGLWMALFFAAWHAWLFLPVCHSLLGSRSINEYFFIRLPCV